MMTKNLAIEVRNLTKIYKLYNSQRDVIKETFHPLRKIYHNEFHALKDISFNLYRGEVLGVIGKNGSGKSTLLKILASVVTPTSGYFKCNGSVSTLLELGGGFNRDLSGIENIYFIGAIQGYSKKYMKLLAPKIIEFAEIGEYVYQPLKTYSSGMQVRLTFSMAIHINPEILLTDEALAVGDLRFQQKCFRKIRQFKEEGKTIMIVSQGMGPINEYCDRVLWLDEGEIRLDGKPKIVTNAYLSYMNSETSMPTIRESSITVSSSIEESKNDLKKSLATTKWNDISKLKSGVFGETIIEKIAFKNETKPEANVLKGGENIRVLIVIRNSVPLNNPGFHLMIDGKHGATIFKINSYAFGKTLKLKENASNLISIDFKFPIISNGQYTLSLSIFDKIKGEPILLQEAFDAMIIKVDNDSPNYRQGAILVLNDVIINEDVID